MVLQLTNVGVRASGMKALELVELLPVINPLATIELVGSPRRHKNEGAAVRSATIKLPLKERHQSAINIALNGRGYCASSGG